MRFFTSIAVLLLAFIATSHAFPSFPLLEARKGDRNGTRGNSIKRVCKQMAKLTRITDLANNQTKLDAMIAKGKIDDEEVAKIKSKAADATSQLQTLMSNSTLVSECAVFNARRKDMGMCKQMDKLTKLAAIQGNQTAVDAYVANKGMGDEEAARLRDIIGNATSKLQELSGNATLTGFCAQLQQQKGASGCKLFTLIRLEDVC
jgi:hypothetical protein